MIKVLRVNDNQIDALKKVLDYVREDEKQDFESFSTEEQQTNHIYQSIRTVDEMLVNV